MTLRELREMVERWRERLAPEWRVEVVLSEADLDGARARVERHDPYHRAEITFSPHILGDERQRICQTVCHELLHLVLADYADAVTGLMGSLGFEAQSVARRTIGELEERAIDRLAWVLAEFETDLDHHFET